MYINIIILDKDDDDEVNVDGLLVVIVVGNINSNY